MSILQYMFSPLKIKDMEVFSSILHECQYHRSHYKMCLKSLHQMMKAVGVLSKTRNQDKHDCELFNKLLHTTPRT